MRTLSLIKALSVLSCLIRNDYNVVFGFLLLIIVIRYLEDNPKFYMKIIMHICAGLIIVDLLWMIIILPYWFADGETSVYWKSLYSMHYFVSILAFLELFVKIGLVSFLFIIYRREYAEEIGDLFKITYDAGVKRK